MFVMLLGVGAIVGLYFLCCKIHDKLDLIDQARQNQMLGIGETNYLSRRLARTPMNWIEPADSEIQIETAKELEEYIDSIHTWTVQVRNTLWDPWVDTDLVFTCRESTLMGIIEELVQIDANQNSNQPSRFYRGYYYEETNSGTDPMVDSLWPGSN